MAINDNQEIFKINMESQQQKISNLTTHFLIRSNSNVNNLKD